MKSIGRTFHECFLVNCVIIIEDCSWKFVWLLPELLEDHFECPNHSIFQCTFSLFFGVFFLHQIFRPSVLTFFVHRQLSIFDGQFWQNAKKLAGKRSLKNIENLLFLNKYIFEKNHNKHQTTFSCNLQFQKI